jgi:hypothetical protein
MLSVDEENETNTLRKVIHQRDAEIARLTNVLTDANRRLQTVGYVPPSYEASLPNDQEYDQLMRIACTAVPDLYDFIGLDPDVIPPSKSDLHDALREGFVSSFYALASPTFVRTAAPSQKLDLSYVKIRIVDLLRAKHRPCGNVSSGALLLAVVAIGDIPYSGFEPKWRHKGVVREVGLTQENHGGKAPDLSAWRRVLAAGKPIAAAAPPWTPPEDRQTRRVSNYGQ